MKGQIDDLTSVPTEYLALLVLPPHYGVTSNDTARRRYVSERAIGKSSSGIPHHTLTLYRKYYVVEEQCHNYLHKRHARVAAIRETQLKTEEG